LKEKQMPPAIFDEMYKLRDEGKVRAIGLSCHHRKFVGRLAADGRIDCMMIRYNAAHSGAEQDIFPYLSQHDPGVISYTATRWRYLLRHPKKNWPANGRIPTPGECYRFVLTNPNVDVCLTAPYKEKQLLENLAAVRQGPLNDEDMKFMYEFGAVVHHTKKWFM
jgi:aryl-alcohol dehydrogenase-like predicted oxidoreductase